MSDPSGERAAGVSDGGQLQFLRVKESRRRVEELLEPLRAAARKCVLPEGMPEGTGNVEEYLLGNICRFWKTISFIPWVPERLKMLEIGAGPVLIAASRIFNYEACAADHHEIWAPAMAEFGIPLRKYEFMEDEIKTLGAFNLLLFLEVIEHIPLPAVEVLERLRGGILPGGYLLLTTPNLPSLRNRLTVLRGRSPLGEFLRYPEGSFSHLREYDLPEILDAFRRSGFEIVRAELVTVGHYAVRLRGLIYRTLVNLVPGWREKIFVLARRR